MNVDKGAMSEHRMQIKMDMLEFLNFKTFPHQKTLVGKSKNKAKQIMTTKTRNRQDIN